MSKHPIGSIEWFRDKKRELVDHGRAADNFATAQRAMEALQATWGRSEETTALALHTAAVINYARPFSSNRGQGGGKRTYSTGHIDKTPGFDRAMHRHLLELRDKLIAHSDADYVDAAAFCFELGVSGRDTVLNADFAIEIPIEVRVAARALHSISDEGLVRAYLAHVTAAAAGAAEKLLAEMNLLLRTAQEHTDAHRQSRESNLPEFFRQEHDLPTDGRLQIPFAPPPASQTLKAPPLKAFGDHYCYRMIEFGVRFHGEYSFKSPSGTEIRAVLGPRVARLETK